MTNTDNKSSILLKYDGYKKGTQFAICVYPAYPKTGI